jgi:alanine racemase
MRTWVEISRDRLAANYRAIRSAVGERVEILAVVKADAYGHGAVEVARTLEAAGASWFAVTSVEEGAELRRRGIHGRIVVLADFAAPHLDAAAELNLTWVVHSIEELRGLEAWARRREFRPRFHLKFDSGMGRLGVSEAHASDVAGLLASCPHLLLEGVATHFASAEDLASDQTRDQIARFRRLVDTLAARGIRPALVHMANSAALAYRPETWADMVRPGLALYGYVMPAAGGDTRPAVRVEPVLTWKARILTVKDIPAGAPLGYSATFRAERPMRVGVVAAGYADGVDRRLSNGGMVLAGGRRVRIVGLVSMDVCLVDLTGAPGVQAGDSVTLLGRDGAESLDAMAVAAQCGALPYEILCRIGKRVARI